MQSLTRRRLLAGSGMAAVSALAVGAAPQERPARPMKILVAGGHPGDPEAGCGGTIARYSREGHKVACLYLTRGQAGVDGKTHAQAAEVRTAEALAACKILGATPLFADQIDGATQITADHYAKFTTLVASVDPDVVFTHWPVDHHRDHRVCAMLTLDAWIETGKKFALYYYEVDLGSDTQCFRPTCFVDVTETEPLKRQACMAHRSQNPERFYLKDHVPMMHFRGIESGYIFAEGFVHHDPSRSAVLP